MKNEKSYEAGEVADDNSLPYMTYVDFQEYRRVCIEDADYGLRHDQWSGVEEDGYWPIGELFHTRKRLGTYAGRYTGENNARYAYENIINNPSDIAIFIPVWIDEPIENVKNTLDQLHEQCAEDELYADVFVCLNDKSPFTLEEYITMSPGVQYDKEHGQRFIDSIYKYAASSARIEDLLDQYTQPFHPLRPQMMTRDFRADENFNAIRTWYMLEYLLDYAIPRRVSKDLPVLWLDADTPRIGKGAIRKGIDAVKNKEAHFVKLFLQLVSDGRSDPAFTKRSEEERVAALYALLRRQIEDNLDPTDNRGYPDESGMMMTLEDYYRIGGVANIDKAVGESRGLLERGKRRLDPTIPLLTVLSDARLFNDYRRATRLASQGKPIDLPMGEAGVDYESDTEMSLHATENTHEALTLGRIVDMFAYMTNRQHEYNKVDKIDRPILTEGQVRRFAGVVLRFFPEFNTYNDAKQSVDELANELGQLANNHT